MAIAQHYAEYRKQGHTALAAYTFATGKHASNSNWSMVRYIGKRTDCFAICLSIHGMLPVIV